MARRMTPLEHLARLVGARTPNPGGAEPALARALATELAAHGADVTVAEVARPQGGPPGAYVYARFGAPRLLLNAHLDTVPVNSGWTSDPFTLRVADGRAYALGAADTKGAIACA